MKTTSIIDVDVFFEHIIEEYTDFGDQAALLATELSSLQPHTIQKRCRHLNACKERLTALDEQLIEILNFAGEELQMSDQLTRYRIAFSSASVAIDEIRSQLLTIRESLQEVTRH